MGKVIYNRRPVRVLNIHRDMFPDDAVFVGRPSKWGNPFRIGQDGTREQVIEKYRRYLLKNKKLMAALPELRGHDLLCYCAPKACHADILFELANAKETTK
jgi:hypothetical protein